MSTAKLIVLVVFLTAIAEMVIGAMIVFSPYVVLRLCHG